MPNGYILWEGTSRLDGRTPIVAIATMGTSKNSKTGDMIQTWILLRDIHPSAAAMDGNDGGICGEGESRCPFAINKEGERGCYVNVAYAPRSVWQAYHRGVYRLWNGEPIVNGRSVRIGAYGDPAAVPVDVWNRFVIGSKGHTGYTHQWRTAPEYRHLLMASVETETAAVVAEYQGWRAFAVLNTAPTRSMIHCPASKERGHKLSCADCLACSGANPNKRSVWILEH